MIRAALFDWDGTLADTAEASYRCYVRMFSAFGIPFDREIYAQSYSPNWYHTFRTLGLPEHRWAEADEEWLRHFAEERVELIDGARELELHGLTTLVKECVFGTDVEEKKPHPAALELCHPERERGTWAVGRCDAPPPARFLAHARNDGGRSMASSSPMTAARSCSARTAARSTCSPAA